MAPIAFAAIAFAGATFQVQAIVFPLRWPHWGWGFDRRLLPGQVPG